MTSRMGSPDLAYPTKSLTARNVLVLMIALFAAFAPAGALAMGHCPAMTSDCYGPCASYACVPTTPPMVMALPDVGDVVATFVPSQPSASFGTPDPPPRARLSV